MKKATCINIKWLFSYFHIIYHKIGILSRGEPFQQPVEPIEYVLYRWVYLALSRQSTTQRGRRRGAGLSCSI